LNSKINNIMDNNLYCFKTEDDTGAKSLNIVCRQGAGFILMQRFFVDEYHEKHGRLLRQWKDKFYVERYINVKAGTLGKFMHIIMHKFY